MVSYLSVDGEKKKGQKEELCWNYWQQTHCIQCGWDLVVVVVIVNRISDPGVAAVVLAVACKAVAVIRREMVER